MVVSICQEKVYEHDSSLTKFLVLTRASTSAEGDFAATEFVVYIVVGL